MKIVLRILVVSFVLFSCTSKFGKVLKSKDNEYKLKMAEQFYATQKYDKARQIYEDVMPYFKGDPRFEDIYFKYAYSAYNLGDYLNAENLFKTYTEIFPNSSKAEESQFMRCMAFYKQSPKVDLDQTNTSKTISLLQAFINTHPESKRIDEATAIIDTSRKKLEQKEEKSARLYYDLGYFKAAAIAFSTLNDNYPDSEDSDAYKLQEIKAYYKYAEMSVPGKQTERYERVLSEITEFMQRFADSDLVMEVNKYKLDTENNINKFNNEQNKETTKL